MDVMPFPTTPFYGGGGVYAKRSVALDRFEQSYLSGHDGKAMTTGEARPRNHFHQSPLASARGLCCLGSTAPAVSPSARWGLVPGRRTLSKLFHQS